MDRLSALVQASAAAAAPAGDHPAARVPPPEVSQHPKPEAPRASVTPPLGTAPVPDATPAPAAVAAAPAAQNMAPPAAAAAPPVAVAAPLAPTTAALMAAAAPPAATAPPHAVAAPAPVTTAPVTTAPPPASDEVARKLAADHAAIREAYAREQAAAAPPAPPAAPLVQGVDDEWADWRGCICGGSYYGEMVGCDGHCDNWFHFACVGLTRLPRGEWLCQDCKNKPKKKKQKVEEPPPPPPPKKRENPAHSKHERKDREQLEALVERAKPLKFVGGRAPSDHTCSGAGFCSLDPTIFAPLQQLHANIVAALRRGKLLQSWEGKGKDVRERGFAFLPPTMIPVWDRARLEKGGLRFGAAQKEGQDFLNDEEANWKSSFHLFPRDVSSEARTALHALIELVKLRVDDKYKAYVSLENLIALQPNLHNDAKHLPPHLDFPLHDGFGVVIVTIQMAGPQSVIALLKGADSDFDITTEKEKERCWTFSLNVGDCYILSGDARNVCDHGVLCVGGGRRTFSFTSRILCRLSGCIEHQPSQRLACSVPILLSQSTCKMQRVIVALALGSAAAFAPAAQPRASVVRFMDEDALKNKILNQGPAEFNKIGGVEVATEMPDDIKFEVPIPAKVMGRWDGECAITVSEGEMKAGSGNSATVNVVPDSMGYEDYYAGFEDAPEWVTVEPAIGKLDRRGGAETTLTVTACPPPGTSFSGELGLVCVLPDDIDKAFKVTLTVGDGVATSDFDAGSDADMG